MPRTRKAWLTWVAAMTTLWLLAYPWLHYGYAVIAIWDGLMVASFLAFWYLATQSNGAHKAPSK